MNFFLKGLFATAIVGAVAIANAGVEFSNFGAGDTYQFGGYEVSGPTNTLTHARQDMGFAFKAVFNGFLTELDVPIIHISGTDGVTVTMFTNQTTAPEGFPLTPIHTWTATGLGTAFNTAPTAIDISAANIQVTAGTKYWFVAKATASDFDGSWATNNQGQTFNRDGVFSSDGGANYIWQGGPTGAFRVQAVPEPASFAAIGLGLLAVARRRRKG